MLANEKELLNEVLGGPERKVVLVSTTIRSGRRRKALPFADAAV